MIITRIVAATMAALLASGAVVAAGAPPAGLATARADFATAVASRNTKQIVALSDFPLAVEMYGAPPTMTAKDFLAHKQMFDNLFGPPDAGIVQCIRSAAAELQSDAKSFGHGNWIVDCNGNEYFF